MKHTERLFGSDSEGEDEEDEDAAEARDESYEMPPASAKSKTTAVIPTVPKSAKAKVDAEAASSKAPNDGRVAQKYCIDELVERLRTWVYMPNAFMVMFLLCVLWFILLLVDSSSELWLILFGLCACCVVATAPLITLHELPGEIQWMGAPASKHSLRWLLRHNNAVRLVVVFESLADIVLAAIALVDTSTLPEVVELAVGAASCASIALVILVASGCNNEYHRDTLDEDQMWLVPLSIVFTDTADVLLLLRVLFVREIAPTSVIVYLFLIINVLITKLTSIVAIRAEASCSVEYPADAEGLTLEQQREKIAKADRKLVGSVKMRSAMRKKSTAQIFMVGLFIIPVAFAATMRDSLPPLEVALFTAPPLLLFAWICFCLKYDSTLAAYAFKDVQLREHLPRLMLVLYMMVLTIVLLAVSNGQLLVMAGAYTLYLVLTLVVGVYEDLSRVESLRQEIQGAQRVDYGERLTPFEFVCVVAPELAKKSSRIQQLDLSASNVAGSFTAAVADSLKKNNSLVELE